MWILSLTLPLTLSIVLSCLLNCQSFSYGKVWCCTCTRGFWMIYAGRVAERQVPINKKPLDKQMRKRLRASDSNILGQVEFHNQWSLQWPGPIFSLHGLYKVVLAQHPKAENAGRFSQWLKRISNKRMRTDIASGRTHPASMHSNSDRSSFAASNSHQPYSWRRGQIKKAVNRRFMLQLKA